MDCVGFSSRDCRAQISRVTLLKRRGIAMQMEEKGLLPLALVWQLNRLTVQLSFVALAIAFILGGPLSGLLLELHGFGGLHGKLAEALQ